MINTVTSFLTKHGLVWTRTSWQINPSLFYDQIKFTEKV